MLKKLMTAAVVTSTLVALSPDSGHAHSSLPHPFKKASIEWSPQGGRTNGVPTLLVGHDGDKYTHLSGGVSTRFRLRADVKTAHRVYGAGITTGDPDMANNIPHSLIGASDRTYWWSVDEHMTFSMDAVTALTSGTPGIQLTLVDDIISQCNEAFNQPPNNNRIIGQRTLTVHGVFSAGPDKAVQFGASSEWYPEGAESRPAYAHATFPINIVCAGDSFRSADAPLPPRAAPKPVSIDLKVDQHGERCPKDVTVTAYADYKSPAKSRMRMRVDGGFPKIRVANTRKVTFAGKTFHRAEAQFKYKLDPGQKTFKLTVDGKKGKTHSEKVEIKCPPFKVTSAWLKYDVEQTPTCPKKVTETATFNTTRPGYVPYEIRMKGGLVVASGKLTAKREGDKYIATAVRKLTMNAIDSEFMADALGQSANSGWVPLEVKCLDLAGDFSFVDMGAPKCPRTGKALITFKSNMPDNIHYSLDCTNGKHLSGFVKPVKQPNGDYVAAAIQTFNIDQTSVYSCALKTVQPGPVKLHKWKAHTFNCVIPSVETGSNDLKPETPQQPDSASTGDRVPGKIVTPIPPKTVPPVIVTPVPEGPQRTGGADKQRIDALKIAKEKAEAERLRRAKIAAEKAAAEKRRKDQIAAQQAAERKRRLEAAKKARLLKLQQERARKAAEAAARARVQAQRASTLQRNKKVKIAPRRRTTGSAAQMRVLRVR